MRIIAKHLAGALIVIGIQIGYVYVTFHSDRGESDPGTWAWWPWYVGFMLSHAVPAIVVARHVLRVNVAALSATAYLLPALILLVPEARLSEADVWALGIAWIGGIIFNPPSVVLAVVGGALYRKVRPIPIRHCSQRKDYINGTDDPRDFAMLLNDCSELARDGSGWITLLRCRVCGEYWELHTETEPSRVGVARRLQSHEAHAKYAV